MGLSRLDIVRDIYNKATDDATENLSAQSAYSRRIRSDIERTTAYLEKTKRLIKEFDNDEVILEKMQVIALYESYNRLSYVDDKDDVIGIAAASISARRAVEAHKSAIETSTAENEKLTQEIKRIRSIITDYKYILSLINEKVSVDSQKAQDIANVEPVTLQQRTDSLQAKFDECNDMLRLLSVHIDNYISSYLVSKWNHSTEPTDAKRLKNLLKELIENDRIKMPEESLERVFLESLRMNNIVVFKSDPSGQYVHLRDYGAEFQ